MVPGAPHSRIKEEGLGKMGQMTLLRNRSSASCC